MTTFRVLTFVTDQAMYDGMRESFELGGFAEPAAVFQVVDNTAGNIGQPYDTVNRVLQEMSERFLILCHQDIRLEGPASLRWLEQQLESAAHAFPEWALAGPAGLDMHYQQVLAITDPWQAPRWHGPWPVEAEVLDELLLVIKPGATRLTDGLNGFHFYAADLCIRARQAGGTALVIDFPVHHLSNGEAGRLSPAYREARDAIQRAWSPSFKMRLLVATTQESVVLSRYRIVRRLLRYRKVQRFLLTVFGSALVP